MAAYEWDNLPDDTLPQLPEEAQERAAEIVKQIINADEHMVLSQDVRIASVRNRKGNMYLSPIHLTEEELPRRFEDGSYVISVTMRVQANDWPQVGELEEQLMEEREEAARVALNASIADMEAKLATKREQLSKLNNK